MNSSNLGLPVLCFVELKRSVRKETSECYLENSSKAVNCIGFSAV